MGVPAPSYSMTVLTFHSFQPGKSLHQGLCRLRELVRLVELQDLEQADVYGGNWPRQWSYEILIELRLRANPSI